MNPKPQEMFAGGSQELQAKRGNGRSSYKDTTPLLFINVRRTNAGSKPEMTYKCWCHKEVDLDSWWSIYGINTINEYSWL